MNTLLKAAAPYLVGAGVLAGLVVGVWMYGGHQYRAGVASERAATLERQARVERAMQEERDRADAQYRGAVLAREAAQRDLSGVRARLDRLLSEQARRRPEIAGASSGPDGAGADWIGGFAACYAAYGDLAADAARWADQVNGLQGFIRGVRP
ncbi:hypothetical protein [Bordetella bronchiseptica]|uniref:hypothetical protein n=1 Tax=Bordetella bronchiseptica TaxID=518 RepID=UPI00045B762B|nr:hypothetical protein [Bordetella bronchiseptica]KAK54011.1 hypothetical protein L576_2372 [Bordetella bronchiseptica OSU054]